MKDGLTHTENSISGITTDEIGTSIGTVTDVRIADGSTDIGSGTLTTNSDGSMTLDRGNLGKVTIGPSDSSGDYTLHIDLGTSANGYKIDYYKECTKSGCTGVSKDQYDKDTGGGVEGGEGGAEGGTHVGQNPNVGGNGSHGVIESSTITNIISNFFSNLFSFLNPSANKVQVPDSVLGFTNATKTERIKVIVANVTTPAIISEVFGNAK